MAGCSMFLSSPDVQVKDVSIVGFDSNAVEVELYFTVKNPNSFPLKLLGYSYDLKVMALPLAKGGARESIEFKAGSSNDLRLLVRIVFRNLYEILKRVPDPDKMPYSMNAGLEVDSPLGIHTFPVESSGIFKIPKKYRPEFYLKQLRNIIGGLVE
jgi:LEA14-like dessication related protein